MPRAIEAMLSRMPGVTSALNGILGGMAAVAGVEIFSRAISGAVTLYDKFISLNSALDEYNKNAEKARQADITDTHRLILLHKTWPNAQYSGVLAGLRISGTDV